MTPPADQIEAAIRDARVFLANCLDHSSPEVVSPFIYRADSKRRFIDPHQAARACVAHCLAHRELPPRWARELVLDVANKKRKWLAKTPRALWITVVVESVCKDFGFDPTRNRATCDNESGCSIVAEALRRLGIDELSESAVEKIWRKEREQVRSMPWLDFRWE